VQDAEDSWFCCVLAFRFGFRTNVASSVASMKRGRARAISCSNPGLFPELLQKSHYSDLVKHRDNSNLSVPCLRASDGGKVICEVSRWHLYGFVKGNHVK
jgi:hypothetical protein